MRLRAQTGFEKVGRQRLVLWTNRPDEWVLLVPSHAYRIVSAPGSGDKPKAQDIIGAPSSFSVTRCGLMQTLSH